MEAKILAQFGSLTTGLDFPSSSHTVQVQGLVDWFCPRPRPWFLVLDGGRNFSGKHRRNVSAHVLGSFSLFGSFRWWTSGLGDSSLDRGLRNSRHHSLAARLFPSHVSHTPTPTLPRSFAQSPPPTRDINYIHASSHHPLPLHPPSLLSSLHQHYSSFHSSSALERGRTKGRRRNHLVVDPRRDAPASPTMPALPQYDWVLAITSIAFIFSSFGNGANDVANSFATRYALWNPSLHNID